MESYTHFKLPSRDPSTNFNITKNDIKSGDFFGILRLDGIICVHLCEHVNTYAYQHGCTFVENRNPKEKFLLHVLFVRIDQPCIKTGTDPLLAWAMGSNTGHTTIAMWEEDELYVMESTVTDSYWPTNGIQKHKFDEWMALCKKASFNMVHLPLSDESRQRFDVNKVKQ